MHDIDRYAKRSSTRFLKLNPSGQILQEHTYTKGFSTETVFY